MTSGMPYEIITYRKPRSAYRKPKQLVAFNGTPEEQRFTFYDRIEIGRYKEGLNAMPGVLLLRDPTVSSRHCIITQTADGHCYIRDVSLNGTKLGGKRLIPSLEVEMELGQVLCVGDQHNFLLTGDVSGDGSTTEKEVAQVTKVRSETAIVTVLVGDIRDYTGLVQSVASQALQQSVRRVFQKLEDEVVQYGGTVKEFRGDAIFAFWEEGASKNQAVDACRAALALDQLTCQLALDREIWYLPDFPLHMDWALATGLVSFGSFGGNRPSGLSVVGEAVVLAFRLEKYANDKRGPIVTCVNTRDRASGVFEFKDLGEKNAKGFPKASKVFALVGAK